MFKRRFKGWIPAFAGMTILKLLALAHGVVFQKFP